jgi:antirestriction protein ArdC
MELRASWPLPDEKQFRYTGLNWLILLLNSVGKEMGACIFLMF